MTPNIHLDGLHTTHCSRSIFSKADVQFAIERSLSNTVTWVDIADAASVVAAATAVGVVAMIIAVVVL